MQHNDVLPFDSFVKAVGLELDERLVAVASRVVVVLDIDVAFPVENIKTDTPNKVN